MRLRGTSKYPGGMVVPAQSQGEQDDYLSMKIPTKFREEPALS